MRSRRSVAPLALLVLASLGAGLPALAQPTFTKSFSPDTIGVGNASRLVFTITNDSGVPVTNLAFTDNLPAQVVLATPPSPTTTCGIASTLTAPDGGSTVSFSGGSVGAFSSCTVEVDVIGVMAGSFDNVSGALTSDAGDSGPAMATLGVSGTLLNFTKSFDPDNVQAGAISRLTLDIANPGGAVDSIGFVDFLPAGLEIATTPNTVNTCGGNLTASPNGTVIVLILGSLPGEGSCEIGVDVRVPVAGNFVNRTGNLGSSSGVAGFAVAEITASVDRLALEKDFIGDPVPPGAKLPLRFTVRNFDRAAATGITFTDDLDATLSGMVAVAPLPTDPCGTGSTLTGTDLLTLSGGSLDGGGSCTFEVDVQVPGGASPGLYPNTTSTITATVGGEPRVGSAAVNVLHVQEGPLLTKTFLSNPVAGGDTVDVEFHLVNTSSTVPITNIGFTDDLLFLPGVTATAEVPAPGFCGPGSAAGVDVIGSLAAFGDMSLDPSGECTFTMTLHVPVNAAAGTYTNITSQVNGLADGTDPIAGPAASDSLVVIGGPHLTKSFVDDPVLPGGTVTLEFTLTGGEAGAEAIDDIAFTDDLGAVIPGLQAIALPADGFCGPSSHMSGSGVLSVTGASLAGGDTCTFQVSLQVPAGALPGTHLNTTSVVSATSGGLAVESAAASDDLHISGLTLGKSFTDDPAVAGGTVTLEFTLTNQSPAATVTNAAFVDDLDATLTGLAPTGLPQNDVCGSGSQLTAAGNVLLLSGGTLGPGGSCTFSVVLQVPPGAAAGGHFNMTGPVTAEFDGNPVEVAGASDQLLVIDALSIGKDFIDDPVAPGGTATLRFTLANAHPSEAATGLGFTDDLGAALSGLTAVALPASGFCGAGSTISGTTTLVVSGASLPAASSCTFDVAVQAPAATPSGTYFNVTGPLSGMVGGSPATAPEASAPLVVTSVALSKAFAGDTAAGRTVVLTFTLENLSASPLTGLAFADDLDAVVPGLVATGLPTSNVCGAGSTLAGTSVLSFTGGSLAAGASCSFPVTLQVPSMATPGTFQNTTTPVTAAGLRVGEPASADLTVEPPPTFAKAFFPTTAYAYRVSRLTFTVDNTASTLPATALAFTDVLPTGLTVASLPLPSSTCGGTVDAVVESNVISFSGGTVGAGMTCTVEVSVTASDPGTYVNVSGPLASSNGAGGTATNTLVIAEPIPALAPWGLLLLAGLIGVLAWRRLS